MEMSVTPDACVNVKIHVYLHRGFFDLCKTSCSEIPNLHESCRPLSKGKFEASVGRVKTNLHINSATPA